MSGLWSGFSGIAKKWLNRVQNKINTRVAGKRAMTQITSDDCAQDAGMLRQKPTLVTAGTGVHGVAYPLVTVRKLGDNALAGEP